MTRTLVLTGANSDMHKVLDLTIPSKTRYCNQHGYDLLIQRSFGELPEYGWNFEDYGTPIIGFMPAYKAFKMLEYYDRVMWLDGDSIITNVDITIEDMTDSNHTFFASYDWLSCVDGGVGRDGFSTGNFIIQRSNQVADLFTTFFEVGSSLLNNTMAEQLTLNMIWKNSNLSHVFKVLDHKYLNSVPRCLEQTETWKNDPNRTGPSAQNKIISEWTESSFIAHLTGISNAERVHILKNNFSKYIYF